MLFFGAAMSAVVVTLYAVMLRLYGGAAASTAAFFTVSLSELLHAFNVRAEGERLSPRAWFSNRALLVTVLAGTALNVLIAVVPALRAAFRLAPLGAAQWLAVALCSAAVLPVGALYRLVVRRLQGRRAVSRRKRRSRARGNAQ